MGNADEASFVAEECVSVGRRNPDSLLQCNTYLRSFRRGSSRLHWCIDPGSQLDYDHVRANLLKQIGSLDELRLFSINHQDPDVVGNLTHLTRENQSLVGLVTEDTWRLVRHLNAAPERLCFVQQHSNNAIKLPGGHRIIGVPTPFCHFRGAVAFYDPEIRVLFTGDLFGGLNEPGRVQMLGQEEDWPGIALFHQIYMPSRAAVAYAVRQIRALTPSVKAIAPQHGFVLAGGFMHDVMERLERLPVGLDRLSSELDTDHFGAYREVFHRAVDLAIDHLGRGEVLDLLRSLPDDDELAACIQVTDQGVDLRARGIDALPLLISVLGHGRPVSFANLLRAEVLHACMQRSLPMPAVAPGIEESSMGDWIG